MEEKSKKQDRKTKQLAAVNKPGSSEQRPNEAMRQVMQQMLQKNSQQDPFETAKQVLDNFVDKQDLPEYLVHSIMHGNNEIAQYLIQKGVSNIPPPSVLQSSWFSVMPNHNEELVKNFKKAPYVVMASQYGRTQILKKLLLHSSSVTEVGYSGIYKTNLVISNVLGTAVFNNQIEVIKFLMEEFSGYDIGIEYKAQEEKGNPSMSSFNKQLTGCTPLLLSLYQKCDIQLLELLINAGSNILAKDLNNNSALHIAVSNNLVEHVDLLLTRGVPIFERNNKGETAESIARSKNYTAIVQLFQSRGDISKQMAEQLLLQEELEEQTKMKKKNKNKEKKHQDEQEEQEPKEPLIINLPPKKQPPQSEQIQERTQQQVQQQIQQTQVKTPKQQSQQPQKRQQQYQVAQQPQQQQQKYSMDESEMNMIDQYQPDQEQVIDKNMQVVGINPEILKGTKKKQEPQKNEPSQNILSMGMKFSVHQQQQSHQGQSSNSQQRQKAQQKPQDNWEQRFAGYQEDEQSSTSGQGISPQGETFVKSEQVQQLETEVQDLNRRLQNIARRMLVLEKDLQNERKRRQELETQIQNRMDYRNQEQDKKELLQMCNEQLKAKAHEISRLKEMINSK